MSRRIGEQNPDGAARAAVQAIVLALFVSIVLGVIGAPLAPKLLALMGGSPWVVEHGAAFTRVMLAGIVTVVMLFMINAIFRGAGDAAIAMRTLSLANWINIVLGPCLIFGLGPFPKMGIVGAAIATNIGRGTGAVYARGSFGLVAYGFLFYAYGMVLGQSFNGAGDTWTPTIINLFVFWLWEIPLAYVLSSVAGLGPRGVFVSMTIAFSTLAVVSAAVFRRGRWKKRVV